MSLRALIQELKAAVMGSGQLLRSGKPFTIGDTVVKPAGKHVFRAAFPKPLVIKHDPDRNKITVGDEEWDENDLGYALQKHGKD